MDAFMIGEFAMAWKADDMEKTALARTVRHLENRLRQKKKFEFMRKNYLIK